MKLESDHVFRENTEKKEHEKTALGCAMWEKPLGTQERLFFGGGGFFVHLSVLSISIEKASTCAQSASAKGPRLAA